MAGLDAGDLRKGLAIMVDAKPHLIEELDFVKPGKGQALYKCRLRNLLTGQLYERTYRSGEKFEQADVTETDIQFLYADAETFHFMHTESYEQLEMSVEAVGVGKNYLTENMNVSSILFEGRPILLNLPNFVVLKVINSENWIKGDTASGATKPVEVETGAVVQAPLFINEGEFIKIDTRTGQYVERVNKK